MDKKIYFQAGNSNADKTVVELLEDAAQTVKLHGDSTLGYLYLQPSTSDDDNATIEVTLWPLDATQANDYRDAIALVKGEEEPQVFFSKTLHKKQINLLEVWNQTEKEKIDKVSDISELLLRAASELRLLGDVTVLDVIMHDHIDNDALYRPYIRIYYEV